MKLGCKVFYQHAELDTWIRNGIPCSTSDPGPKRTDRRARSDARPKGKSQRSRSRARRRNRMDAQSSVSNQRTGLGGTDSATSGLNSLHPAVSNAAALRSGCGSGAFGVLASRSAHGYGINLGVLRIASQVQWVACRPTPPQSWRFLSLFDRSPRGKCSDTVQARRRADSRSGEQERGRTEVRLQSPETAIAPRALLNG